MKLFSRTLCAIALCIAGCHDNKNGAGGNGAGPNGACNAGSASAASEAILAGLQQPFAIAVDDSAIYFTETGSSETVRRADKDGGNATILVTETGAPEDLAVDDLYVYYRTPTLKRASKTTPGAAMVLASGFDDLHSNGMFVDGEQLFFAGTDSAHGGAEVLMRVDRDGTNLTTLLSGTSEVHLVGLDAANLYYSIDAVGGAMQLSLPRGGGTPTVIGSGEACFTAAIDATYLYCSGVTHPFKLRLAGGGSQIPLCVNDLTYSVNTLGRLALAHDHLYLLSIPHLSPIDQPPDSGSVLDVSTFGGGHTWASGVDDPRMIVTDGTALYWTEDRLGVIRKLAL